MYFRSKKHTPDTWVALKARGPDTRVVLDETAINTLPPALLKQLADAGIEQPKTFDLFPQPKAHRFEGNYYRDEIIGISENNKVFSGLAELQVIPPERDNATCASYQLQDNMLLAKVFGGLHETAHYLGEVLKLDDAVYEAMMKNDPMEVDPKKNWGCPR